MDSNVNPCGVPVRVSQTNCPTSPLATRLKDSSELQSGCLPANPPLISQNIPFWMSQCSICNSIVASYASRAPISPLYPLYRSTRIDRNPPMMLETSIPRCLRCNEKGIHRAFEAPERIFLATFLDKLGARGSGEETAVKSSAD